MVNILFYFRKYTVLKLLRRLLCLLLPAHILFGCVAALPIAELHYTSGAVVESLSSNASLSYASPDRSISGSGMLMFRKPDQIRAVIISPFGSVLQEVYLHGEQIAIVDSGNGIAFAGNYTDLPEKGDLSGWRYIHWLMDVGTPDSRNGTAVVERTNRFGQQEKVFFEKGLLVSKWLSDGSHVTYGRYTTAQGVAYPLEIRYETSEKDTFTILLEDPEINLPFAEDTFTPKLGQLRVFPISTLK